MTSTKITRLTQDQVSALTEIWYADNDSSPLTGRPYEVTPTTASFRNDGDDAWEWVENQIRNTPDMPPRGYPRQALRSIQRKLRRAADDQRKAVEMEVTRQLAAYEPEMDTYTRRAQEHEVHTTVSDTLADYFDCGEPANDWGTRTPEHEEEG